MTDEQWFQMHPDRQARIRLPIQVLVKSKQRSVGYAAECWEEFATLGDHDRSRRRIILYRLPKDNPAYDPDKQPILKIPFLAFADETIEDTDEVLLPVIHEIMSDARKRYMS